MPLFSQCHVDLENTILTILWCISKPLSLCSPSKHADVLGIKPSLGSQVDLKKHKNILTQGTPVELKEVGLFTYEFRRLPWVPSQPADTTPLLLEPWRRSTLAHQIASASSLNSLIPWIISIVKTLDSCQQEFSWMGTGSGQLHCWSTLRLCGWECQKYDLIAALSNK